VLKRKFSHEILGIIFTFNLCSPFVGRNLLSKTSDADSLYDGSLDGGVHYPELNWKENKELMDKKVSASNYVPSYARGENHNSEKSSEQQVK